MCQGAADHAVLLKAEGPASVRPLNPQPQPPMSKPEYRGFPTLGVAFLGGSYNKDYNIWGYILGSPYFGELPYINTILRSI